MQYGCIGEKLKHSFSKEIHESLGGYKYDICEVERDKLDSFMSRADFLGINVTIPYKEAVIPYLAEIDEGARAIGAVNTIVKRDGLLYGYNTDFYGMSALIGRMKLSLRGKKVAVLGTGGTAKTANAVASSLGAGEIITVGRSQKDGVITYGELYARHTDVDVIVNTTPCGMYPYPDGNEERAGEAVDISAFPSLSGVVDAVYNPLSTNLVLAGRARGIPSEGGLYMLVAQAVRASEIFFDKTYPPSVLEEVYLKILKSKECIVLSGMPTSGKSTVGRLIAEMTGRSFVDTDELVVEKIQMPISDFFRQYGEEAFRDVESEALAEASLRSCCVIATGGGAVLRDINVKRLKRNGRIVFLDRPLSELVPTSDRPLASSREAIEKKYNERYGRYLSVSDIRIEVKDTPEKVAEAVLREFNRK